MIDTERMSKIIENFPIVTREDEHIIHNYSETELLVGNIGIIVSENTISLIQSN